MEEVTRLRLTAFLAAVLVLPASAGVVAPLPGAALEMHAPQLAVDLGAQLSQLEGAAPQLVAPSLLTTISQPGVTPTQVAAARLIVEAVAHPAYIPALRALLPGEAGRAAGDKLLVLASRVHAAQVQDSFHEVSAALPNVENGFGTAWHADAVGGIKQSLDAFFAGAVKSGALEMETAVDGAGEKRMPGDWKLRKPADPMKEVFRVVIGNKRIPAQITVQQLFDAIESQDAAFVDRFLPRAEGASPKRVVRLFNDAARVTITLVDDGKGGERLLWADFYESDKHPLLGKLAQKFTFVPFKHGGSRTLQYEAPNIDGDNAQLTVYGLKLEADGGIADGEALHVYVGKKLLVTTHEQARPSVTKAQRLLTETGRYKSPKDMMSFLLGDTINRYSLVIDSLSSDFAAINEKVGKKDADESIMQDAVAAGRKIDVIHETVLKQRQVLRDLLSINQFHQSEYVPVAEIERHVQALDHHLTVLDHYQERKNGLIELYRAKVSNELDEAMKRLAALSMLVAPAAIVGSLMGMNIVIPGMNMPHVFWLVIGLISAVTGGLFVLFRRKKWL